MNNVQLIGNLSTGVRVRETQSGKKTASFKVAVNRPGTEGKADYVWVKVWNGTAEACAKYLNGPDREKGIKASRVAVEGSISTSRVEKDGNFTEYVEVNARRVTFLSTRQAEQAGEEAPASVEASTPAPTDDDIPF